MPYDSGLISYAAFASLALAMKKHGNSLGWSALPPPRVLRILGWALMALSVIVAVARLGLALGVTAWFAQLCVAAPLLVLMLSWRPRLSAILAGVSLVCALFTAIR
jgi:uncharacterized membrane protein YhdT